MSAVKARSTICGQRRAGGQAGGQAGRQQAQVRAAATGRQAGRQVGGDAWIPLQGKDQGWSQPERQAPRMRGTGQCLRSARLPCRWPGVWSRTLPPAPAQPHPAQHSPAQPGTHLPQLADRSVQVLGVSCHRTCHVSGRQLSMQLLQHRLRRRGRGRQQLLPGLTHGLRRSGVPQPQAG